MYKVKYSKQSVKALRKMPANWAKRICKKIDDLAKSPDKSNQIKALKGADAYRLRVGDWRVIYTINNNELEIWIVKIASRGEVYQS